MGGSESWASPEMAVALRGIGVAASDFSAITPLSTSAQSALQNFVLNGGAAIMGIVYLIYSGAERARTTNTTINYSL
jgi:hypothetical protein